MAKTFSVTSPPPPLPATVRDLLGDLLRRSIAPASGNLPPNLRAAIHHLTLAPTRADAGMEREFRQGLVAAMPRLRSLAISLTRSPQGADDLVQETMLRA